jgi:RNA polymerase sigma factor (sigma-70 family)
LSRKTEYRIHNCRFFGYCQGTPTGRAALATASWNDIPFEFQARVVAGDPTVLAPLASWLHAHPPGRIDEDVVQKVLITLVRLMGTKQGQSLLTRIRSVPNFLASIATRHRVDELRAEARLQRILKSAASRGKAPPTPEPLSIIARTEIREAILEAFERLPPVEREILGRIVLLGESYRSIASTVFGGDDRARAERRVRKLAFRARRILRSRLRRLGRA